MPDPISLGRVIVDMGKSLIPPTDADPDKVWWWRFSIAVFIGVNTMANALHIAWACGWLAGFGLPGFALQAAEVTVHNEMKTGLDKTVAEFKMQQNATQNSVDELKLILLNQSLKSTLISRCIAIAQHNQTALDSANADITQYEMQYFTLTKLSYRERPCSVILIAQGQ